MLLYLLKWVVYRPCKCNCSVESLQYTKIAVIIALRQLHSAHTTCCHAAVANTESGSLTCDGWYATAGNSACGCRYKPGFHTHQATQSKQSQCQRIMLMQQADLRKLCMAVCSYDTQHTCEVSHVKLVLRPHIDDLGRGCTSLQPPCQLPSIQPAGTLSLHHSC